MRTVKSGKRVEICLEHHNRASTRINWGARPHASDGPSIRAVLQSPRSALVSQMPRMLVHRIYPWMCYTLVVNGAVRRAFAHYGHDATRIVTQVSIVAPVVALMITAVRRHRRVQTASGWMSRWFSRYCGFTIALTLLFATLVCAFFPYKWYATRAARPRAS